MNTGGCACGAVRYRAEGALRPVVACHCETCRRTSGHHVAATSCLRESFTLTGEVQWWSATPGYRRGFCPTCGSQLFWQREGSPRISIFAGTLDSPTGLRLHGHIYISEKGDYYDLTDGLPATPLTDPDLTTDPAEGAA